MSSEEDTPAPQPATATAAQGSFHTGGLAGVGGAAEGGYRDKEPAPSYDGVSPETTFRQYEKNIRLWQFESDVPARKQGVKMMRSLTGLARLAVDDMEFEEIACESGAKNVLAKLRDYFLPHLEVSLPRAFEAAVYGNARALSESQEQRVLTWCEGSYNRDEIIKALRRLDKVVRDGGKSSKASYVQENVEAFAVEAENGEEEDSEDGEHIFLADGDLDQVYEENEVKEALASYRETRQALKALRTNRGYFPNGYKKDGFKGFGKGKSKGKRKVHVEQLKLRSRCWNCGAVGHWSEECKQPRTGVARGPPSSSGGSSNTGFYVAASKKDEPRALEGEVLEEEGEQSRSFWLRSFVEEQRSNLATSGAFDSASSSAYKERRSRGKETGGFCGIVTKPSQGIVDTAAEGGLIGEVALKRHDSELRRFGLKCKWIPKVSSAKGVGGSAKVVGVTLIPVGIGGINGILEATVVEGEVPLLLPIGMLKTLGAVIDLQNDVMRLRNHNITVDLETMSSGHVAVDVTSFEDGEFQVLHEAGCHGEFHLPPCNNSAMLAQLKKDNRNSKPEFLSHGVDFPASIGIADGKAAKCWQSGAPEPVVVTQPMHQERRALRNWRAIMDKVITLVTLVVLQDAVKDWCPLPLEQPQPLAQEESINTIEDLYYHIIRDAKSLAPLKSSTPPTVSSSSCIHPKKELKAGGNASASYVVCKLCHSRWECPARATELKKELKQNVGPLSKNNTEKLQTQGVMEVDEEESVKKEMVRSAASAASSQQTQKLLEQELKTLRQEARERELKQEKMMQAVMANQQRQMMEVQQAQLMQMQTINRL